MVYCDGYCCELGKPSLAPEHIKGAHFHCQVCPDFHLCANCYNKFQLPGWWIKWKKDNCHPNDNHAFKKTKKRPIKKVTWA